MVSSTIQRDWSDLDPAYTNVFLNAIPSADLAVEVLPNSEAIEAVQNTLVKCSPEDPECIKTITGY